MTYTHRPVQPASEVERLIASAIDPLPFERLAERRTQPGDTHRRSQAVRRARRIVETLDAGRHVIVERADP